MEEILNTSPEIVFRYGLSTVILILIVIIIRMGIHHSLFHGTGLSAESRWRWAANIRDILLIIFILGIGFIRAPKIQPFAVSLLTIALALVLVTKEIITCISGSILRMVTKAYALGDRIEIGSIRGNVVDHNALTTTILKIGPGQTSHQYTERAMVIPNSFIFDHPLEKVSSRISLCSSLCLTRPNSCTRNLHNQLIPAHSFKTERPSYGIQRFAFSVKLW